jgi:hypothetical protein
MKALDVSGRTVERVRQCLVEGGLATVLNGRPHQRYKKVRSWTVSKKRQ